jgi:hypothetical protein
MITMIIQSRGMGIPYNVIEDINGIREPEGKHIPLPAKSNREWAEAIQEFVNKAQEDREKLYLLIVNEELCTNLKLEREDGIDCMLFYYADNNGRPAVSVWKNSLGDEGVTYEEFLEDLKNYDPNANREAAQPKVMVRSQRAA